MSEEYIYLSVVFNYVWMFCLIMVSVQGSALVQLSNWNFILLMDDWSKKFLILLMVISSSVLLWSYYYMSEEENYSRFVGMVIIFIFCMLMLIVGGSLVMALVGWDGLGATSFLLVIYYKNRKSLGSGMITALTNRLGDCFFLTMLGLFMKESSSMYWWVVLVLLISMTKSAQMPFSAWFPSAMAAPTPVSALVHSSTLVTAGVYLMLRFNSFSFEWMLLLGSMTMFMAGAAACVEMDVKKIVALSTLSQLGVMMVALSIYQKEMCFFHLMVHAMFKALLFMSVGVAIHSFYGGQEFRSFNNLSKMVILPMSMMVVANMALMGVPFMAGFFSKDMIMESFYSSYSSYTMGVLFLMGVGLTSAYSVKMMSLVGYSNSSTLPVSNKVGGMTWTTKIPLLMLGGMSVMSGFVLSQELSMSVVMLTSDKLMPAGMILGGALMGFLVSKSKSLSSMAMLVPAYQKMSSMSKWGENIVKGEKEFIEMGPIMMSGMQRISLSFHPMVAVGIMSLFLLF
uniref:NADH-ubiquinone oxidoreductase chain 5 n=1 Tax=Flaccisagitta enflata TaxID=366393 RepID=D3DKN8_9BILA|nr:NADH dehydrogenase subunit 5 [Flaccisagitta enflata]BAI68187.1 NADH dehydrogenase subunit 5 [Flaccisagitta enflata]